MRPMCPGGGRAQVHGLGRGSELHEGGGAGGLEALESLSCSWRYGSRPATSRTPASDVWERKGRHAPTRPPALQGPRGASAGQGGLGRRTQGKDPKPSPPFQRSKTLLTLAGASGNPEGKCNTRKCGKFRECPAAKLLPGTPGKALPSSPQPPGGGQSGGGGGGQAGGGDTDKCTLLLGATHSQQPGRSPPHPVRLAGTGGSGAPSWRRTVFHHLSPRPPEQTTWEPRGPGTPPHRARHTVEHTPGPGTAGGPAGAAASRDARSPTSRSSAPTPWPSEARAPGRESCWTAGSSSGRRRCSRARGPRRRWSHSWTAGSSPECGA